MAELHMFPRNRWFHPFPFNCAFRRHLILASAFLERAFFFKLLWHCSLLEFQTMLPNLLVKKLTHRQTGRRLGKMDFYFGCNTKLHACCFRGLGTISNRWLPLYSRNETFIFYSRFYGFFLWSTRCMWLLCRKALLVWKALYKQSLLLTQICHVAH